MFIQNPITGGIGPNLHDFLILRRRGVPRTQVWFTGVSYAGPNQKRSTSRARGKPPRSVSPPIGRGPEGSPFDFSTRDKRGLVGMVVYLLSNTSMNGTEIMGEVGRLTPGGWRPAAGSVYPLLRDLLEQRIITRTKEGDRYVPSDWMKSRNRNTAGPIPVLAPHHRRHGESDAELRFVHGRCQELRYERPRPSQEQAAGACKENRGFDGRRRTLRAALAGPGFRLVPAYQGHRPRVRRGNLPAGECIRVPNPEVGRLR